MAEWEPVDQRIQKPLYRLITDLNIIVLVANIKGNNCQEWINREYSTLRVGYCTNFSLFLTPKTSLYSQPEYSVDNDCFYSRTFSAAGCRLWNTLYAIVFSAEYSGLQISTSLVFPSRVYLSRLFPCRIRFASWLLAGLSIYFGWYNDLLGSNHRLMPWTI